MIRDQGQVLVLAVYGKNGENVVHMSDVDGPSKSELPLGSPFASELDSQLSSDEADLLRDVLTVVVTGVPGSGKTTLGRALAQTLDAKFFSLDAIKESLFESSGGTLGGHDLRLAAEAQLSVALTSTTGSTVVDLWVQPGRDTARVAKLLRRTSSRMVEVLCRVPAEVAVDRYSQRSRSGPHKPPDEETLQRIRDAAAEFGPTGVGPCVEIDTSAPVDVDTLVASLQGAYSG